MGVEQAVLPDLKKNYNFIRNEVFKPFIPLPLILKPLY